MNNAPRRNEKRLSRTQLRLISLGVLLLTAVAFTAHDILVRFPRAPGPGEGVERQVIVRRGAGPDEIARELVRVGALESGGRFALYVRLSGSMPALQAGNFILRDDMTPLQILKVLSGRGSEKGVRVTIPEGFRLSQTAALLDGLGLVKQGDFRAAALDPALLAALGIPAQAAEGFLFPDTYYFSESVTAREVLSRMHANFREKTADLGLKAEELLPTVTLASIVQAEAKIPEEATVIAGVYANRLDGSTFPSRRLQADPTVAYGCDAFVLPQPSSCRAFKGVLTHAQLLDEQNPYNTYRHPGLPPGPICAPGLQALRAAADPPDVPYLYFVVSENGRHTFSTTYEDHLKAVRRYRTKR
jgi:UPF0755 protein